MSGIPRWSLFGEGSPSTLCQRQSTTKLLGQRGHWRGRERALSSSNAAHLHKEPFQSYWLAGFLLGFFQCLCTEYQSSSLTGLPHKLATVTKKETQNDAPLSRLQGGSPRPSAGWGFTALTRSRTTSVWCPSQKNFRWSKTKKLSVSHL